MRFILNPVIIERPPRPPKVISEEQKAAVSKALKGRKRPAEVKEKISKGLLEHYKTHDHALKGKPLPEEWRLKVQDTMRKKYAGV